MPTPWRRRAVLAYSIHSRHRKGRMVVRFMRRRRVRDAVFVGCSPGRHPNELIVERAVAAQVDVRLACDVLPCDESPWPFVVADGRDLPVPDKFTDLVLAQAVIEHVGDLVDQRRFVTEQTRVARSWVITTPNRWFPVEPHTSVLLRHWSPRWRAGRREFTRLLSRREFRSLLPADARVVGRPWSPTFSGLWPDPRTGVRARARATAERELTAISLLLIGAT